METTALGAGSGNWPELCGGNTLRVWTSFLVSSFQSKTRAPAGQTDSPGLRPLPLTKCPSLWTTGLPRGGQRAFLWGSCVGHRPTTWGCTPQQSGSWGARNGPHKDFGPTSALAKGTLGRNCHKGPEGPSLSVQDSQTEALLTCHAEKVPVEGGGPLGRWLQGTGPSKKISKMKT